MKVSCIVAVSLVLLSGAFVAGGQSEPTLADGPGKDVVERVCGECHDAPSRITKLKKSETEWAEVITDMEGRGMTASEKDLEIVLAYLTKHYGSAPAVQVFSAPLTAFAEAPAVSPTRERRRNGRPIAAHRQRLH